jgi:hypothetical protein
MIVWKLKTAADETLIAAYTEAVIRTSEAQAQMRPRVANWHADKILQIARELRRRGPEAQKKLLPLLHHSNPHVRGWSATHALGFAPEEALPVLRALAKERGDPGFDARIALQEWEKGTLGLP